MFKFGERVKTTMGIRQAGRVIRTCPKDQWTDGSYRYPHRYEKPVYVLWDNGTRGWTYQSILTIEEN